MDPITNLSPSATAAEIKAMLTRVIDFLKNAGHHRDLHQPDPGGSATGADRGGHHLR